MDSKTSLLVAIAAVAIGLIVYKLWENNKKQAVAKLFGLLDDNDKLGKTKLMFGDDHHNDDHDELCEPLDFKLPKVDIRLQKTELTGRGDKIRGDLNISPHIKPAWTPTSNNPLDRVNGYFS